MEIIVILLFILMFFGAKSIPGIARTLGKGMREIQHASNEIRNEIRQTTDQIKKDASIGRELDETIRTFEHRQQETINKINTEINNAVKPIEQGVNSTVRDIEGSAKTDQTNNPSSLKEKEDLSDKNKENQ